MTNINDMPTAQAALKYFKKMEERKPQSLHEVSQVRAERKSELPPSADQFANKPAAQAFANIMKKMNSTQAGPIQESSTVAVYKKKDVAPIAPRATSKRKMMSASELIEEALSTSPEEAVDRLISQLTEDTDE